MNTATILKPSTIPIPKVCRECGKAFDLQFPAFAEWVNVCPACSEADGLRTTQELLRTAEDTRMRRWEVICPTSYRETVPCKLPSPSKLQKVFAWQYGPRGLLLHGPTGSGKSRCAWLLAKREFDRGRFVRSLDCGAGATYAEMYAKSAERVAGWMRGLVSADLLLLDDVFKSKITDSFEAALFSVVEHRMQENAPVIVTVNDVASTLKDRMTEDRGPALMRRLQDACTAIAF